MEDMDIHLEAYRAMEVEYRKTLLDLHRAWRAGKLTTAQYNQSFNEMELALRPGSIEKKNANIAAVRELWLQEEK